MGFLWDRNNDCIRHLSFVQRFSIFKSKTFQKAEVLNYTEPLRSHFICILCQKKSSVSLYKTFCLALAPPTHSGWPHSFFSWLHPLGPLMFEIIHLSNPLQCFVTTHLSPPQSSTYCTYPHTLRSHGHGSVRASLSSHSDFFLKSVLNQNEGEYNYTTIGLGRYKSCIKHKFRPFLSSWSYS